MQVCIHKHKVVPKSYEHSAVPCARTDQAAWQSDQGIRDLIEHIERCYIALLPVILPTAVDARPVWMRPSPD
jgi:hypothetical protein